MSALPHLNGVAEMVIGRAHHHHMTARTPKLEKLPDGRTVAVLEHMSQLALIHGAVEVARMLRRTVPYLAELDQSPTVLKLRADVDEILRQVEPGVSP